MPDNENTVVMKAKALVPKLNSRGRRWTTQRALKSCNRSRWVGKEHSGRNQLTPKGPIKTYLCNTCKDNQTEFAAMKPVFICKEKKNKAFSIHNSNHI